MPRSTKANADLNRQRLFDEAQRQFAARGFHATSIANIAGEVGLTKQTLLHHFGSKEGLFSEVLTELADTLAQRIVDVKAGHLDPVERFEIFMLETLDSDSGDQMQIVIRELLENQDRAPATEHWHLKDYLEALTEMVKAIPENSHLSDAEAFAHLYHVLGAISYFKISQPTLKGMLGERKFRAVKRSFEQQIRQIIRSQVPYSPHQRSSNEAM